MIVNVYIYVQCVQHGTASHDIPCPSNAIHGLPTSRCKGMSPIARKCRSGGRWCRTQRCCKFCDSFFCAHLQSHCQKYYTVSSRITKTNCETSRSSREGALKLWVSQHRTAHRRHPQDSSLRNWKAHSWSVGLEGSTFEYFEYVWAIPWYSINMLILHYHPLYIHCISMGYSSSLGYPWRGFLALQLSVESPGAHCSQ